MLRISLIVAILAGIGALVVGQLQVVSKISGLEASLADTQQKLQTAQNAETSAKKTAKDAVAAADKAKKELETAKTDLAAATDKADQQEKRATDLEARLNKTTQERNDSQAKLARWEVLGRSIEQLQAMIGENKKLLTEREAVAGENKVLSRDNIQLRSKLEFFEGKKTHVDLPAGLKGKVVSVDPKYEFVVLDVGLDQGVLERGEMLINRSGRLVAKVRILSVEPNRSIANVLPEWKQAEILEGDAAIVGL
ncbi:MAG TPA: hypothetical protein VLU94_02340 [Candidatus Nitrosotalea sp.]|nr:hypothetical protein [Candidatus Nitrosotalea sp.]